jgi:hypothetical protein
MIRLTYVNEGIGKEFIKKACKERNHYMMYRDVLEDLLRLYIKYGESIFSDEFGKKLLEGERTTSISIY